MKKFVLSITAFIIILFVFTYMRAEISKELKEVAIFDISLAPDKNSIGFHQRLGPHGSLGNNRVILNIHDKTFSYITTNPDYINIRSINLESGLNNATGTVFNVREEMYSLVKFNLEKGTFKKIFSTKSPILETALCNNNLVFIMGKRRDSGVNRMVGRDIYKVNITGQQEPTKVTARDFYQMSLLHVNKDCDEIYYDYYDGRDTLAKNIKGKDEQIPLLEGIGNTGVFSGDIYPAKQLIFLRSGYFANGETIIINDNKIMYRESYNFPSTTAFSNDGNIGVQIKGNKDLEKFVIFFYDMASFSKSEISLKGYTKRNMVLKESVN